MQVGRVLETCLYVDDLEAAEDFYSRVLGLEAFARVEGRHVFFRCNSGVVLLFNPIECRKQTGDAPAHGAEGPGHVAFSISAVDIDRWRDYLDACEVRIEKEMAWPHGGYSLYFRDPAGNSLELTTPETWGLVRDE